MSVDAVYRNRHARVVDDLTEDHEGFAAWIGVVLEYRDGTRDEVRFGDPELEVEPDDDVWDDAID